MLGALGRIPSWQGLLGLWPQADKDKAMAALHRVGVSDYAGQRANTLSGGQQQRGAIARAIVQGAKAILADEPVASLDPVSARKVMELLVELNKRDGMGVIVTLHQVDYAIRYCDRVIALQSGKIVYDGPATGLDHQRLIDIYGPEFEDAFWETKA
jgi:phosphonate transport system ATP-binding protein